MPAETKGTSEEDYKSMVEQQKNSCITEVREEYLAMMFITSTNDKKYKLLVTQLENKMLKRNDCYPKTLVDAYNKHYTGKPPSSSNVNTLKAGHTCPWPNPNVRCYQCGHLGHVAGACTETTTIEGAALFMMNGSK